MRLVAYDGARALRQGALVLGALALLAGGASAQMVFDGNVLFNNNGSGTLPGQFTGTTSTGPLCLGLTPAQIGTVTYTHNLYADPLLPNAPYKASVVPVWQPNAASPAYNHSMLLPFDGFFEQVCYSGAIGPNAGDDWTLGWTYYDSSGTFRQDLHLATMPDPRPLAIYPNVILNTLFNFAPDSNYLIRGQLRVAFGGELHVPAGVVIFEERATLGTIRIDRGGKIFCDGTSAQPIIVTSDDPPGTMHTGAGGGIIVNGRARINNANSCLGDSAASEGGAVGFYGGNDDDDDSGVLRFVRVEYAGKEITPNNELNSFTFNGVGRRTIIDYIQAHRGADDAIEFFGGTAQGKHMVGTDGTDDGFDWQMGYRGKAQFVILRASPLFAPSGTQNGDKGIEADNNENDFEATVCAGYSNPIVSNFTMIGDKRVGASFPGPTSGVNLRRGTAGQVLNSIVYNFKTAGLRIDDNATLQHHCASPPVAPTVYCPDNLSVPIQSGNVMVVRSAPNPFRTRVDFAFTLPQAGNVVVEIFAADGRRVQTLEKGTLPAGPHTVTWNLDRATPSGMYFYKVLVDGASSTGKITRVD